MIKKFKSLFLILALMFAYSSTMLGSLASDTKYPDYARQYCGKDKLEGFNRKMFAFNLKVNKYVLKPVNIVWSSIMPKYGMDRIKNVYTNIEYPKRVVSSLIRKDFKTAGKESKRFIINTTVGIGGMFDPAKSKFKLEPAREDMDKALANCKVPSGPYLVLPFLPPSTVRGYLGKIFDYALTPSTYTFGLGFVPSIAKACCTVNSTTYAQGLIGTLDGTFADPYDIAKKAYGLDNYIKNSNIDKKDVRGELLDSEGFERISNIPDLQIGLQPDISLTDYEAQSPIVDSMRTAYFGSPELNKSAWADISLWNRSFNRKISSDFINLVPGRDDYKFRFLLQKDKNAPIAIFYPSIGEGVMSHHSVVFAKMFYDKGYSVVIQGSAFQWEFVKSCPIEFRPGIPERDAKYVRLASQKIIKKLVDTEKITPSETIIVGTSYGGLSTLCVGAQEQKEDTLGVTKYIAVSPPVELFYSLSMLDENAKKWNENTENLKERTAVVANKIYQITKNMNDNDPSNDPKTLPFSDEEGMFVIDFIMKQKLSDVIFTIENSSRSKTSPIYNQVNDMNFNDYVEQYLVPSYDGPKEKLVSEMGLGVINDFLKTSDKYKIYTAMDDYFINKNQISWLKDIGKNKVVVLQNGSHLGFLYRDEFKNSFKEDIALDKKFETPDVVVKETKEIENKS